MKFLLLFAVVSLSQASRIIPSGIKHKLPIQVNQPVVDINVTAAHLPRPIKAILHVFVFVPQTADQKFELPLSKSKLNQKTKIFTYLTKSTGLISFDPIFNYTFSPINPYYNESSYIAVEIWDNTSEFSYVGGVQMTVKELEQLPRSTSLKLTDSNGLTAGTVDVQYKVPKK